MVIAGTDADVARVANAYAFAVKAMNDVLANVTVRFFFVPLVNDPSVVCGAFV